MKKETVAAAVVAKISFSFPFTYLLLLMNVWSPFKLLKMKKTKKKKYTHRGKKQEMKFTLNYEYNNQLVARAIHAQTHTTHHRRHIVWIISITVCLYIAFDTVNIVYIELCRLCLCHPFNYSSSKEERTGERARKKPTWNWKNEQKNNSEMNVSYIVRQSQIISL